MFSSSDILRSPSEAPLCLLWFHCAGFISTSRRCFTKAEELRLKHEEFLSKQNIKAKPEQEEAMDVQSASEEDDDDDFDEFLNWRDKVS